MSKEKNDRMKNKSKSQAQLTFKKDEIALKNNFIREISVVMLIFFVAYFGRVFFWDSKQIFIWIYFVLLNLEFILIIVLYCYIQSLMKKFHDFEYQRT